MHDFRPKSLVQQVADHLKAEILQGSILGTMPGIPTLVAKLAIHHTTAHEALKILEKEGLIKSRGVGRPRVIVTEARKSSALRVMILPYEMEDQDRSYMTSMMSSLRQAGHTVSFTKRSMRDLGMDPKRVSRFVNGVEADAWVVNAGSRELLQWFSQQDTPAFALYGRYPSVDIAASGIRGSLTFREVVQRLVKLGHRRIVLLTGEDRREPEPGLPERAFLNELEAHGIETSSYHLPPWREDPSGLVERLNSMFRVSPPTALLISTSEVFLAAQKHLAELGIHAPRDVSLICAQYSSSFAWYHPRISHFYDPLEKVVQRVVRWVEQVARGIDDRAKRDYKSTFIEGGTIGPPPKP